jgi:DsbC/DsbD-like thiol-disulfide interchange protein
LVRIGQEEPMLMYLKKIAALVAAVSFFPVAGVASELRNIVHVEVIDGGLAHDGAQIGALRIILADGWKTYWRAPGDAGIPPLFDFSASRNLSDAEIVWPTPQVFEQSGMTTIGYEQEVILPLRIAVIEPGVAVQLSGRVELGVCQDVCIPATLRFDGMISATSKPNPAIVAALASKPYSAAEANVRSVSCQIGVNSNGVTVTATIKMPSAGGQETVVFEPGIADVWASQAEVYRDGAVLTASADLMHASGGPFGMDRSRLRITVLGRAHAVDIMGCSAP